MGERCYYVYIMTNKKDGVLYIGITSDPFRRVTEHKFGLVKGFTHKYNLSRLVYIEDCGDVHAALQREKNLKHWVRAWKVELIEKQNPEWADLAAEWGLEDPRVTPASAYAAADRPEDDAVL